MKPSIQPCFPQAGNAAEFHFVLLVDPLREGFQQLMLEPLLAVCIVLVVFHYFAGLHTKEKFEKFYVIARDIKR